MTRRLAKLLGVAALVVLGGIVVLAALQRQLLYPRHLVAAPDSPRNLPAGGEQIWIETPEGRVEGWYMTGRGRSKEDPGPAVIFTHGNGEIIDHWPRLMQWYADRGISVLLAEYRGYGRSEGDPSAPKIREDMERFHEWLTSRPEVDPEALIYHGRSLGGGAVCALAGEHPPAAMILQSTFTSVADMAWHHYAVPEFLLRDEFDNLSYVESADVPILVTHGSADEIVPVEQGRELHRAAPNSEFVEIEECGHNDCPMRWDAISEFLDERGLMP